MDKLDFSQRQSRRNVMPISDEVIKRITKVRLFNDKKLPRREV